MERTRPRLLSNAQARLAAWADRRLLPGVLVLLLATDLAFAANWALSPAEQLQAPAYDVAKQVAPMLVHGVLLAVVASVAATVAVTRGRGLLSGWFVGPVAGAVWWFWGVLFALAHRPGAGPSYGGVILAVALCALHLLAGAALAHRPARKG